jgi:hypothetical protein
MQPEIVHNFVSNEIIRPGCELQISYVNHQAFGGPATMKDIFKLVRVIDAKGKYFFTLTDIEFEKKAIYATSEQIVEVDGMTVERIIKAFNLEQDGRKKPRKPRKKHVRKNKIVQEAVA